MSERVTDVAVGSGHVRNSQKWCLTFHIRVGIKKSGGETIYTDMAYFHTRIKNLHVQQEGTRTSPEGEFK